MFKSEAKLFLSANNNLNYAKTLINECKRLVTEIELQGNSDYTNCKNNITNCDIDGLVNKVDTTKENLMKLDPDFANEYMTLLQEYLETASMDVSKMTEEEQMQYSIQMSGYARDYNCCLLYMLEKYEESGMLTPELQAQLEIQRTIVEQYDVQDKMAALTTTSQEYIDLFKSNAEYDKKLINLNPNLTEEEKASYLEEYENNFNSTLEILELNRDVAQKTDELKNLEAGSEAYYKKENEIRQIQIDYYEGKGSLTEQEQKQLEFLKDGVELNELYIDKEQNNGFWHPFIEGEYDEAILDKKIEMGIATEDEIAYDKMNGWERAWENTKTFTTSFVFGIGSVTETVIDGGVMLAGEVGSWFGADTQWAEDFVSIHYADDAYTGLVQSDFINSVSAYSGWHTAGNMVGTTVGYVALSYLPGGPIVTGLAGGFSAMGSSSQRALDSGSTFHEAFGTGAVSFGAGFVSGWGIGKFNAFASANTTSMLQVGRNILIGGGISTLEPIVNSVAEYAIYANDMVDENGNRVYDNIWDYYLSGGGLTNTIMAFGMGGISTGISSFKGYRQFQEVKNAYVDKVVASKMDDAKWDYAKQQYELKNGKDSFWNLTDAERAKLKAEVDISTDSFRLKQAEYEQIAQDTVDSILELKSNGMIKPEYSAKDVLSMIEEGVPQKNYLTESAVSEWQKNWTPDANGNVEVYCFQDSSNSYALKNGTVGRPPTSGSTSINPAGDGGAFVMTKTQYEELLANRNIFDANGNCIDIDALSEALGGVKFQGSPISIKQTVPLDSVEMPMGNNQGSFLGEWRPGGKTSGGVIEGVVPQNFTGNSSNGSTLPGTNVEIIKH